MRQVAATLITFAQYEPERLVEHLKVRFDLTDVRIENGDPAGRVRYIRCVLPCKADEMRAEYFVNGWEAGYAARRYVPCPNCAGEGQRGDGYPGRVDVTCSDCDGTGIIGRTQEGE